jgi:transposase
MTINHKEADLMAQSILATVPASRIRSEPHPAGPSRPAATPPRAFLGLDLGDRNCTWCLLPPRGEDRKEGQLGMDREEVASFLGSLPRPTLIVMEVCSHSPWVSRLGRQLGHEVIVADSRRVHLISKHHRKNDVRDAYMLARMARADRKLLNPVQHRSEQQQADLSRLSVRQGLVQCRTKLINQVRGLVKPFGQRIPLCSASSFHRRAKDHLPPMLVETLQPLLEMIAELTAQIRRCNQGIQELCESRYRCTQPMRQVAGVGYVTSLRFALVLQSHERIRRSRQVGPLLGLVPRLERSCSHDPQLRISKAGDRELRRLLVIAANYMLRKSSPDSDLKRLGQKICERGGKNARKRAKVAMARRLAILLHHLWKTGEVYDPLYLAKKNATHTDA